MVTTLIAMTTANSVPTTTEPAIPIETVSRRHPGVTAHSTEHLSLVALALELPRNGLQTHKQGSQGGDTPEHPKRNDLGRDGSLRFGLRL